MLLDHNVPNHLNPLFKYGPDYKARYCDHITITTIAPGVFRIDFGRVANERGVPSIQGDRISEVDQAAGIIVPEYTLRMLLSLIPKHFQEYQKALRTSKARSVLEEEPCDGACKDCGDCEE